MKILAKAVVNHNNLRRDYIKQFDGVEIQLLDSSLQFGMDNLLKEIEEYKVSIYSKQAHQ